VQSNRSFATVVVGDSISSSSWVTDEQGNTLTLLPTIASGNTAVITVGADSSLTNRPTNQAFYFVKGAGFGTAIVIATSDALADTINFEAIPARVAIVGVPDTMRSNDVATYTLTAEDVNGDPIPTVPDSLLSLASDNSAVLTVDGVASTATATEAGIAVLTASGPGGSEGVQAVNVTADVPFEAELSAADFGATFATGTATLELLILDDNGNENHFPTEITSTTVLSSLPGVATVATTVQDTLNDGTGRNIFVTVTGVAAGISNISGSATTSTGALPWGPVTVTVLDPVITPATPTTATGANYTINGTGLAATGFLTEVLVNGDPVGNVVSASATAVNVDLPTLEPGGYTLTVSVGGVGSNVDSWTVNTSFDEAASEPNDDIGQEAQITSGWAFDGSGDFTTDFSDLFKFTVSEDDLIIDMTLSFVDGANDLDALIYTIGGQSPGSYAVDDCAFHLSTLANPEVGQCDLGDAGEYTLEILTWGGPTAYTVTATFQ